MLRIVNFALQTKAGIVMETRMYNPGRQKSLGLLGAWCSSFEKSAAKPVEIPLRDQNNRIVTRIVLNSALAHRIVVGLW